MQGKYKGLTGLMKMRKVDVIQGNGKLTGKNTIDVDGTTYTGEHIILATGSVSKTMGLEIGGRVMTSTEALEIDAVSYTHLDVYKRQGIGMPFTIATRETRNRWASPTTAAAKRSHWVSGSGPVSSRKCRSRPSVTRCRSVSYTHLDVYKRQV